MELYSQTVQIKIDLPKEILIDMLNIYGTTDPSAAILRDMSQMYFSKGNNNYGIICAKKHTDLYPENRDGWLILTQYYIQSNIKDTESIKKGIYYFKKLTILEQSPGLLLDYSKVCRSINNNKEAIWALKFALKLDPTNISCQGNLGFAIYNDGKHEEGIREIQKAINMIESTKKELRDKWNILDFEEYLTFYNVLCKIFHCLGLKEKIAKLLSYAPNIFPNHLLLPLLKFTDNNTYINKNENTINNETLAIIHFEQGKQYVQKGDLNAASIEYLKACELMPKNSILHYSAAMTLRFTGNHEIAFEHSKIAWKNEPDNMMFFSDYMHLLRATCRWSKFNKHYNKVEKVLKSKDYNLMDHFRLSGIYWGFSMELLYKLSHKAAKKYKVNTNLQYNHTPNPNDINKKLKIAYVSSNYRNHAQGFQMMNYFKNHDKSNFVVYAFSLYPAITKEAIKIRDIIKDQVDHWIEVHDTSPEETAKIIKNHNIDIIIDLCGQADHPRTETYAYRPAPVQISFLGYPGTTGADFMDYYVGDPISTPFEMGPYFSEKLILMPNTYQITEHKEEYPNILSRNIIKNNSDQVIFCNFNNPIKITYEIFKSWMNILKQVPNSILWLFSHKAEKNVKTEIKNHGVDPERVIFLQSTEKETHLKRMQKADLLLDTNVYNAHTSAGDALWAGLPILTILGDTMAERVCSSMLKSAELPEMITHSIEEYERLAIYYGNNISKLRMKREKIEKMRNEMKLKLFDTEQYTKDFEMALRETWKIFSLGKNPSAFRVDEIK